MNIVTEAIRSDCYSRVDFHRWGTKSEYRNSGSWQYGFTKPDKPVINEPVDGYRKPSSYSCPAFGTPFVKASAFYSGPDGFGFGDELYVRDDTYLFVNVKDFGRKMPSPPNVNNLRMKVLNNVRQEVFDVAMVLAEMQGTTDVITNGMLRIARSMDAIKNRKPESYSYLLSGRRRDNRRPTDKFLRETAGIFLEWKYGITPTVLDIQGATKALDINENGGLFDNPPLLVARAVDVQNSSFDSTLEGPGTPSSYGGVPCTVDVRIERKARLDYRVEGEGLRGLNRYGLGLGTIPTLLFERTPFSFVLNMALPLADLIKAWTALAGAKVVGYCETTHTSAKVRASSFAREWRYVDIPVAVTEIDTPWVNWERVAYPSVPMPLPFVRNPITTGNLATALALFTQLRKP